MVYPQCLLIFFFKNRTYFTLGQLSQDTRKLSSQLFSLQVEWQSNGDQLLFTLRKLNDVKFAAVSGIMNLVLTLLD